MARLMVFLIACREFFCLGLFSRRALRHGTFCSLAGKHRSPCCVVVVAHPGIQTQPKFKSSPGTSFSSLGLPEIVHLWPLMPHIDSKNWEIPCDALLCVAPTLPVHSLAASEMVLPLVQRLPANTEGSHYFLAVPLGRRTLSHFLFPALLRIAT